MCVMCVMDFKLNFLLQNKTVFETSSNMNSETVTHVTHITHIGVSH